MAISRIHYSPSIARLSEQSLPSLPKRRLDYLASLESKWDITTTDLPKKYFTPVRGSSCLNNGGRLYVNRAPDLRHSREQLVPLVKIPDLKLPSLHYEEKACRSIRYYGAIDEERGLLLRGATKYFVDQRGRGFNRHKTNQDIPLDTLIKFPTCEALDIERLKFS